MPRGERCTKASYWQPVKIQAATFKSACALLRSRLAKTVEKVARREPYFLMDYIYLKTTNTITYDYRLRRIGHPVRSAIFVEPNEQTPYCAGSPGVSILQNLYINIPCNSILFQNDGHLVRR